VGGRDRSPVGEPQEPHTPGHGCLTVTPLTASTCLARCADKNHLDYKAALALIQMGKDKLEKDPRPDMPGFRLTDEQEVAQQRKYDAMRRANAEAKAAAAAGKKHFAGAE